MGIYGNGVHMTEKVLDFLWGRQNVTLNNIANVDTPGFKAQYVTFEEELGRKFRKETKTLYGGSGFFYASIFEDDLDRGAAFRWQQC